MKALYYDPAKEIIWIGTHLGGLNKLDIRTGTFTHYLMEEGNPVLKAFGIDKEKNVTIHEIEITE